MQYLHLFTLLLSLFSLIDGLCLDCPVTVTTYSCPGSGKIAGTWCDDQCNPVTVTCDSTPIPPPPPQTCSSCPEPVTPLSPNYKCADGVSIGGPFCNVDTCTWDYNNCPKPVLNRPGSCPVPSSSEVPDCTSGSYQCKGDVDCPDSQKCCTDACGTSCKTAVTDLPPLNAGYCPVVVVVPTDPPCARGCMFDSNCTSSQKCCPTVCGGSECKTALSNNGECTRDSCGPPPAVTPLYCADGSTTGPFCRNVDGICRYVFRVCETGPDPVEHDGHCPAITGVQTDNCTSACERDSSCTPDKRCCFDGCQNGRQCTQPVTQQCVVAGFRKMRCLDATVAANLNLPVDVPPDNHYLPEPCYRCVENAICASNGTDCNWSPSFGECLRKCAAPQNKTNNPCDARNLCDCLNYPNFCAWCQYSQTYTDPAKGAVTVSLGRCIHNFLANKCTADVSSAGYAGNLITAKPTDCSSTSVSPNVIDPTSAIKDTQVKDIIKKVCDGNFDISDYQEILTANGIKDIIINEVAPGTAGSDGLSGKIHLALESLGNLTPDQIITALKQALATIFNIDVSQITIELLAKSGVKRAGSSGFLASTTVNPGSSVIPTPSSNPAPQQTPSPSNQPINSPSSGSFVSPIWLVTLLVLLPIWRN